MRTLEQLKDTIEDEVGYVDVKPYSHNIISITLRIIAENYGQTEANKAIREFGLVKLGWKITPKK